jgi:hypothetical protein
MDPRETPPAVPTEAEIRAFMARQVECWNAGDRAGMDALYRRYAPDSLTIEYVGQPLGDGWKTYEHMWDAYAGRVRTDIVEILVNANEGAVFARNVRVASGLANPSIETYRFEPGSLHIRYFHRADTR